MITGMKSKQMFQTFPKITKLRAKNSIVHESHENDWENVYKPIRLEYLYYPFNKSWGRRNIVIAF